MHILVSASLYPSSVTPQRGLFVEKRLLALKSALPTSDFTVIVPTPYFPWKNSFWGHYADYAKVPVRDIRFGQEINYKRYLHIPFCNHYFTVDMVIYALESSLKKLIQMQKKPHILVAEYGFPDGIAMARLGKKYQIPVICTARGSDISYFPQIPHIFKQYQQSFTDIAGMIAVSHRMKQDVAALGYPPEKITVIGNGVDNSLFHYAPADKKFKKQYLQDDEKMILCVGGLIPRKRHDIAIESMRFLSKTKLYIIGTGEQESLLRQKIHDFGLTDKVFLLGQKTHQELARFYQNADLFLLCSASEGRANVLLEAAACGCPLLSSNVGGSDEIIIDNSIGSIFENHTPENISAIVQKMLSYSYNREQIAHNMNGLSWDKTAQDYKDFILHIIE